ncbi:cytochrome c biogenesis heme-transporting ATPase CcmA [Paraneptunicella aestuarii]|uniref:cytochrome c biogenesis heme-transporting ATPase CcmA n=1 Tax=Paraneptunicella aestuarii TaxID=2831148 RepID=UPI001E30E4A7|nr:cytochrome c biogenesis heme-transporting ATPase CcmA [Paraneptunicella aestuarii]UAA38137.1 cytochrome c biogenesis heme-transporting ATPase CcmA [Paraneptunicella aestuarii]
MSRLHAQGLSCIKRDRLLFDNLDLLVEPGQMLVVTGPNGAGKTSLLRILSGLASPEEGTVFWSEQNIYEDNTQYASDLIYIGHKLGFSANLSALENLQFWLQQRQIHRSVDDILEVLDDLALIGMEDVLVRQMSAGQQRRVALAKLWLAPAALWILDEPLTALDKVGVQMLQQKMAEQVLAGGSIITTSHQDFSVEININILALEASW